MSRGLFAFVLQLFAGIGVTGVGVWAVTRPRHLQRFINSNFAVLPRVKDTVQVTAVLLWLAGILALWYGGLLIGGFRQELSALGFG
jgi:hypothetical protein